MNDANDWLPCVYALGLIGLGSTLAAVVGYWAGRWREQLSLLQICKPET